MHKPYLLLSPIGGLIRLARREIRFLGTGFYDNGFPDWEIEVLIEETNKILTHYGTKSLTLLSIERTIINIFRNMQTIVDMLTESFQFAP